MKSITISPARSLSLSCREISSAASRFVLTAVSSMLVSLVDLPELTSIATNASIIPITGGSFLGDRVRINNAVSDNDVFVRSMGSRAELGGVTELAEDFSDILAFSGKDIIFIETVGVGQSEYSVSEITDLTTLVFVPESGDEIQLLKAGIFRRTWVRCL